MTRDKKVWMLWKRLHRADLVLGLAKSEELWTRFNTVIIRKFGKPGC